MAGMFMPPPKPPKQKTIRDNPEIAKQAINRERRRSGGGFQSTIVGSGLKTSTGA